MPLEGVLRIEDELQHRDVREPVAAADLERGAELLERGQRVQALQSVQIDQPEPRRLLLRADDRPPNPSKLVRASQSVMMIASTTLRD